MVDLHRHCEYSTFDGFGKPEELAKIAKEKGHTALGISDHGNTSALVKHNEACQKQGIKPILGCEVYFLPAWVEQSRGYHLCLFAKNLVGYENLNRLQSEGWKHKFYNPIVLLSDLRRYRDGLICTTACIGSYFGKAISAGKESQCKKLLVEMQKIFKNDLYIEIQPYKVDSEGMQEKVNHALIGLGDELNIKCVLTSDSHRGNSEDYSTYMKMHEMAKHGKIDIEMTYRERYIPTEKEMIDRFVKMHTPSLAEYKEYAVEGSMSKARQMISNLEEIESKVEQNILAQLQPCLPIFEDGVDSKNLLKQMVKDGLKEKGKFKSRYIQRALEELEVICHHGYEDYFLMVQDYVSYSKKNNIVVGVGRGSACNCLIAYAVGITEVDPVEHDLDYHRFIRMDKIKMPDIDIDFQTSRRGEVIEYLLHKYGDKAALIVSYGRYQPSVLINDLAGVCGLEMAGRDISEDVKISNSQTIASIKRHVNKYVLENKSLDVEGIMSDEETKIYNKQYDNIVLHFMKLYSKLKYFGTHAAGVAIVGNDLTKYSAIKIDDKTRKRYIAYDLNDAESVNIIKFDLLGLKTLEELSELRKMSGVGQPNYDKLIVDKKILDAFGRGDTTGIFQFESTSARKILQIINADCFNDVVAANSMNRPGPLTLKMHETYAINKEKAKHGELDLSHGYLRYLDKTYGTLIYQEQVQAIATNIGGLSWNAADKIIKMDSGRVDQEQKRKMLDYESEFIPNAAKHGIDEQEAKGLFSEFFNYSFNKGHATGYTLISFEEMFYKVYYPALYWYAKLKFCIKDELKYTFVEDAVADGVVIMLPHVNYTADYSLRTEDGETAIQQGLMAYKGVGEKAAAQIEEEKRANGIFTSYDDFYDRCKHGAVNVGVIRVLQEQGALEFRKSVYVSRTTKYNAALYMRGMKRRK